MQEVWLPVVGFKGFYSVSDWARVRSEARTRAGGGEAVCKVSEKLLSPWLDDKGYLRVTLFRPGKRIHRRLHQVVAAAFLGPRPEGLIVLHSNKEKHDNRPSNLSYGTHEQNNGADRVRDDTHMRGERCVTSKITEEQALYVIRELRDAPRGTVARLARELGVNYATIDHIKRGRTWAWLAA